MSREENISDSWEQYADESELEKRLEKEKVRREMSIESSSGGCIGQNSFGGDDFKPRILQRQQPKIQENQIKILKRPESLASSSSITQTQNSSKPQIKTLEQREKEYAEARKRILGSVETSPPTDQNQLNKQVVTNNLSPSSSSNSLRNCIQSNQINLNSRNSDILRQPKGPSTSPGFQIRR